LYDGVYSFFAKRGCQENRAQRMSDMKRHNLQAISTISVWIGGTITAASFVSKLLFHLSFQGTPFFFAMFVIGLMLWIVAELMG
jgi:hypothetical protein